MKTPREINQVLELALQQGDYATVYRFLAYAAQVWGDIGLLQNVAMPRVHGLNRKTLGFIPRRGRPVTKAA